MCRDMALSEKNVAVYLTWPDYDVSILSKIHSYYYSKCNKE